MVQVPEEPTLTVYFNTPNDNFSLNIQYKQTDAGIYYTANLKKLLVDDISLPLSQKSYTFQEAGEHTVKYYITGNTVRDVFGCIEEGEELSNPSHYISKIILSKRAAISLSEGYKLWVKYGHPVAGEVYFNGTKAEWETIMSGSVPFEFTSMKRQIDNFVHCTDGDISYE